MLVGEENMKSIIIIVMVVIGSIGLIVGLFFTVGIENEIVDPCGYALRGMLETGDNENKEKIKELGKILQNNECWNDPRWPERGVINMDAIYPGF